MTHAQPPAFHPLLIEIDEASFAEARDRVKPWLAIVTSVQSALRRMLEDTVPNVNEPYLHDYLGVVLQAAQEHEDRITDLYRAFGHEPASTGVVESTTAAVIAKTREAVGQVEGLAGGAHAKNWRTLRVIVLTNLDAISGFAVVEQLGLALGRPQVIGITFPIVHQKTEHQLFLQEALLEMAPLAILYHRDL